MKKYILILGLLLLTLTSCNNNEDDFLFKESASERLNKAIKTYKEILVSSKNGWAMEYYPNKKQLYGGFVYTFNFDAKNKVSVRFDLLSSKEVSKSKYDIISSGGPTLTFDTYNNSLHYFSTPNTYSPQSLGGDYEFLILSYKNDEVLLKGKKTGTVMRMVKLKKSPIEHIDAVRGVYGSVVYAKFISMTVNEKEIPIKKDGANRFFSATGNFSDGDQIKNIPYIHTEEGIKLFKPITIEGVTVSKLKLDRQKGSYISDDGKVVIKLSPFPPFSILDRWELTKGSSNSEAFNKVFNKIKKANEEKYPKEKFYNSMLFGYANYGLPGISFKSGNKEIYYFMRIEGVKNKPTQVKVTAYSPGFVNWRNYTHLKPMVDLFVNNSPYNVKISKGSYKLTSVANPNMWFVIKR